MKINGRCKKKKKRATQNRIQSKREIKKNRKRKKEKKKWSIDKGREEKGGGKIKEIGNKRKQVIDK